MGTAEGGATIKGDVTNKAEIGVNESEQVGGIVGSLFNSSVENAENFGRVIGKRYIGGIAGYADKDSEIIGVINDEAEIGANESEQVGGIVGYLHNSTIENANNSGKVIGNNDIGGIAGYAAKDSKIIGVINDEAKIGRNESKIIGGIVGKLINSRVTNAKNSGKVRGVSCVGGIAGIAVEGAAIENVIVNKGEIGRNESSYVGGIVGSLNIQT